MPDNPAAETAQDVTAHAEFPGRATVLLMAAVLGAIVAGTAALWAHYGTAVFFETIRAGFAACFG
ncbi:hypothetical protein [Rhodoplanes sp. Z2-YC6860]|uniref:hypothetical protein n=1 Tax=Rhodoplanes sp. Z2-YC6860 TaxID=674703 RepID=UPI0008375CF3|nr:hypothetical protein [Rhodoplanes sp. Z2-YC6860]